MVTTITHFDIRNLRKDDFEQMFLAFRSSFDNYPVPFRLSKREFRKKFINKLNLDFELSVGAFYNDKLVGFIFTSICNYEGVMTAYNGGTGVIPSFRGHGLVRKLYNHLIPRFREKGINQCILEVLVENEPAIKAYEGVGFRKTNDFKCYKLLSTNFIEPHVQMDDLKISIGDKPDWQTFSRFFDNNPSYLDCQEMVDKNLANEVILLAKAGKDVVGYCIFQPVIGRISQLAVSPDYRRKGIGSALLSYMMDMSHKNSLTIINVIDSGGPIIKFLRNLGFENEIDQYEMRMAI